MATYHVGLLVPSSNLTMEAELPRMMADRQAVIPDQQFVFHSSRMRMKHVTPEELAEMNSQVDRAAGEVADTRPDVVATACLVAIMAQGPGYHDEAESQIADVLKVLNCDAPVVSSAGALVRALQHLNARRVAIVTPYMRPLTAKVVEYLEGSGVQVVDSLSLEVADNLAVANLDPADLSEHWRRLDLSEADALVLSVCVQMPSLSVVDQVEQKCDLPVVTAATATAFALLEALGLETFVPHAGRLLAANRGGPRTLAVSQSA